MTLAVDLGRAPESDATEAIPCITPRGATQSGVLHLPVAPRCNLHCYYCERDADCVHDSARGSQSVLLTPLQAIRHMQEAIAREPRIRAVGISGPGDPLANPDETLRTLNKIAELRSGRCLFMHTSGLSLERHADELADLGLSFATVAVNAVDATIGEQLNEWVRTEDGLLEGRHGSQHLIEQQLAGIQALARRSVQVRVNVMVVPGVNDHHVPAIATAVRSVGAKVLKLTPYQPLSAGEGGPMAGVLAPTPEMMARAHAAAERIISVVRHCRQCASDSVGCLKSEHASSLRRSLAVAASEPQIEPTPPPMSERLPSGERGVAHRWLVLLVRIAKFLASASFGEDALRQVLVWLAEDCGFSRNVIAVRNEEGDELTAVATFGIDRETAAKMRYRAFEGITGQVFATGAPVFSPQLQADPVFLDRSGLRSTLDRSKLAFFCVPIKDRDIVIGTLSADRPNTDIKDADADLMLLAEVAQLLAPFLQRHRLEENLELFARIRSKDGSFASLIGRSAAMEEVRRLAAKVGGTNTSVLVTGETGTGKGVVAALIHELGPRRNEPFLDVNCGAIPENLIESELFGHEKGAFTGAHQKRLGVLERAGSGTVFLDEVGELTLPAQTKLLRVLQTRQFERVGGTKTERFEARIVAATNRDLAADVRDGRFRADLFYRLNVFPIQMPPLRERGKADVMLLADSFIQRFAKEMSKPIFRIDTPAIDMITAYHWPGNVRELENVIERAVVLAEGDVIHGHHLPPSLQMNRYAAKQVDVSDFLTRVANFEIELITEALKDASGNQTKAAERLGVTKRIIQYKIRQYGIDWKRFQ